MCRWMVLTAVFILAAGPVAAQSMIALSGTAASAGGNYISFGFPLLSTTGQVAFSATLTGGSSTQGIFAGAPGSIQAAALLGTAAPAGGNYDSFVPPVLNGTGQVVFKAGLTGGSSTQGLFLGVPGSLQAAALQGTTAPAGGNYNGLGAPVLNGTGQVAFLAALSSGSNPGGIFVGAPGSLQTAALVGTAAPAGGNYNTLADPVLNGAGQVAFSTLLTGGSSTQGIFVGAPGAVQAAALNGTAAPAGGNYSGFGNPVLNGAGKVAFQATLSGGSSTRGIFVGAPGAVQATALQGTAAPAGGDYVSFFNPVLNGAGQVAFRANLPASFQGLFAGAPGAIQTVALVGAAAPRGGNYTALSDAVINGIGQVAFTSDLNTSINARGLFAGMPGNLSAIVLNGDVIDVDPGVGVDLRTVTSINFLTGNGSGGQDGRAMSLNDDGLLVYRLGFTDGSQGIFTSVVAVPEPSSLLLLASAGLVAGGWMMRRRHRGLGRVRTGAMVCVYSR